MKDWFDAVSNGNVERMQQLIRDEIPVDIVNEVNLGMLQSYCFQFISVQFSGETVLLVFRGFSSVREKQPSFGSRTPCSSDHR